MFIFAYILYEPMHPFQLLFLSQRCVFLHVKIHDTHGKRRSNKGGAQVIVEHKYMLFALMETYSWTTLCHAAKMSLTDALVIVGGFTLLFHFMKAARKCYCGFREFILSEFWQVDLRTYGQWAGKVQNLISFWFVEFSETFGQRIHRKLYIIVGDK